MLPLTVLSLGLAAAPPAPKPAPPPEELLTYRVVIPLSQFRSAELALKSDGSGTATIDRQAREVIAVRLNAEELAALRLRIRASHLAAARDGTPSPPDAAEITLRVREGATAHEVHFWDTRQVAPLSTYLWHLTRQSVLISDLQHGKSAYEVEAALTFPTPESDVVQPRAFVSPLQRVIREEKEAAVVEHALNALARITTPDEWVGFVGAELERADPDRRAMLRDLLPLSGSERNIPSAHVRALRQIGEELPK